MNGYTAATEDPESAMRVVERHCIWVHTTPVGESLQNVDVLPLFVGDAQRTVTEALSASDRVDPAAASLAAAGPAAD